MTSIPAHASAFVIEYRLSNGLIFRADRRTPVAAIVNEIFRDRVYENDFILPLEPNMTVIDIGANVGVFAASIASEPLNCMVYAYEPSPESFRLLRSNMRANGLENVHCHQAAISAHDGDSQLYLDRSSSCDSLVAPSNPEREGRISEILTVKTMTLEQIFASLAIDQAGLTKIDAEGSEAEILLSSHPRIIRRSARYAVEYHDYLVAGVGNAVVDCLTNCGFLVTMHPDDSGGGYVFAVRSDLRDSQSSQKVSSPT